MTNAGGNKFDDSLKSPLQLTIIVEDAINRNSFTNKLFFIINTIYTLGSNLVIMYKLPSVHKKCRQTSKFPSYLEGIQGRHPQYKINCRVLESQSLVSFRLQCHY